MVPSSQWTPLLYVTATVYPSTGLEKHAPSTPPPNACRPNRVGPVRPKPRDLPEHRITGRTAGLTEELVKAVGQKLVRQKGLVRSVNVW